MVGLFAERSLSTAVLNARLHDDGTLRNLMFILLVFLLRLSLWQFISAKKCK